jgi:ferric-dicitrate binding protein FerR (iron transport regulator)
MFVYQYAESTEGRIALSDGSIVWLREGSVLRAPKNFTGKSRKVIFKGEGYFEIQTNSDNPFIIEAGGTTTRVLGTKFSLNTNNADSSISLILDEGRVSFAMDGKPKKNSIILEPGERIRCNPETNEIHLERNTRLNHAAWKTKQLIFRNNRLHEIVNDIEDFYNIELHDIPQNLVNETYNFTIDSGTSLEKAIEIISLTIDHPIAKKGDFYYIQTSE